VKAGNWLLRGNDWGAWPFPPHYPRKRGLITLISLPPLALAIVPLGDIAFILLVVLWGAVASSMTVASILDWGRRARADDADVTRRGRSVARILVSGLGVVGAALGLWMAWSSAAAGWRGETPLSGVLVGFCVATFIAIVGAQLAALPYSFGSVDSHEDRGA
jgi:hypothetical protein